MLVYFCYNELGKMFINLTLGPCRVTIAPESNIKVTRTKGIDHKLKKLLFIKQILLVSSLRNVLRTVWRICILMLECKREK